MAGAPASASPAGRLCPGTASEQPAFEYYRSGTQPFHHPDVGDLGLDYDALEVVTDPGMIIVTYTRSATGPHALALTRHLGRREHMSDKVQAAAGLLSHQQTADLTSARKR